MVTVTATPYPDVAKVRLDVTFTNAGVTAALIERRDPGAPWVPVRSGSAYPIVAKVPSPPVDDFEAPFDVPVSYRVSQQAPAGAETATVTTTLPSQSETWLKDPTFPSRNVLLYEVNELPELTYPSRSGVFAVIDRPRPVVVAARRQMWTGTLGFTTATDTERIRVNDLLARGQVLLLSTPADYGIGNVYLYAGDATETRLGVVTDQTRRWSLPITVVDRPDTLSLVSLGMRWVDVKNTYPTWGDLAATGMTWAQLLESEP